METFNVTQLTLGWEDQVTHTEHCTNFGMQNTLSQLKHQQDRVPPWSHHQDNSQSVTTAALAVGSGTAKE